MNHSSTDAEVCGTYTQNASVPWKFAFNIKPEVRQLIADDSTWFTAVQCYNLILRNSTQLPTAATVAQERTTQTQNSASFQSNDYNAVGIANVLQTCGKVHFWAFTQIPLPYITQLYYHAPVLSNPAGLQTIWRPGGMQSVFQQLPCGHWAPCHPALSWMHWRKHDCLNADI